MQEREKVRRTEGGRESLKENIREQKCERSRDYHMLQRERDLKWLSEGA